MVDTVYVENGSPFTLFDLYASNNLVNPLVPEGSPFDEPNRLALNTVKSISHYWALKG